MVSPPAAALAYPRRRVPRWLPIAALAAALGAGGAFLALASDGEDPRPSGQAADRGATGAGAEPRSEPEPRRPARSERARTPTGAAAPRQTAPPAETRQVAPSAPAAPAPAAPRSGPPPVPKNPAAGRRLNDQGFALSRQGRVQEAIPVLERAVASFPENSTDINYAFALFNLAHAYRLAGRPAEAIPLLEKRLTFDNQRAVVQRELQLARQEARRSGS